MTGKSLPRNASAFRNGAAKINTAAVPCVSLSAGVKQCLPLAPYPLPLPRTPTCELATGSPANTPASSTTYTL